MDRPAQPDAKKAGPKISLRVVWTAVRRHPLLFTLAVLLAAGVAAAVWVYTPLPKHTAYMIYHISGQPPRVVTGATASQTMDLNSYKQLQLATVKKRLVLNTALKNDELKKASFLTRETSPVEWLEKNVQVDFKTGNEFMRVYIEGDQPDEMLAVLKALRGAYYDELKSQEGVSEDTRLTGIEALITEKHQEIKRLQVRWDGFLEEVGTADPTGLILIDVLNKDQVTSVRKEVAEIDRQLDLAKADLQAATSDATPAVAAVVPTVLLAAPLASVPPAAVTEAVVREPELIAAEAALTARRNDLTALAGKVDASSPRLAKAQADVAAAEQARDKLKTELRTRVAAGIKDRMAAAAAVKADLARARIEELTKRKTATDEQYQLIKDMIARHGNRKVDLENLKKEIVQKEKLLNHLEEQRDMIKIEQKAPSRVKLTEEPYVVAGVEGQRRLRNAGMAAGGVLALSLAGLVGWELRSRRVTRTDDLAKSLGLPLLGTIPPSEAGGGGELVEAVDAARTVILHGRPADQPLRTLVVTSALPGEGKTTLSGHLAISLARAGYRTLLVDGDVHSPAIHNLFDLPPAPGLCEVLRAEVGAAEVVRPTAVPGLAVLPAGRWTALTRQHLVSDRWSVIRRQFEKQYDFVVVDTAPLLLITDSLLLARNSDGVILSVLLGVSQVGSVGETQDRLTALGARVLGVIVNGARSPYLSRYGYGYGRYKPADEPAASLPATPN